jgi:hypothetical protein
VLLVGTITEENVSVEKNVLFCSVFFDVAVEVKRELDEFCKKMGGSVRETIGSVRLVGELFIAG